MFVNIGVIVHYITFLASGTLVAGSNTITINVISGSSGDAFLVCAFTILIRSRY
jgi:hypothetical protein